MSPDSRSYSAISSSQFNQNYSATRITFSISGYVRNVNNLRDFRRFHPAQRQRGNRDDRKQRILR